MSLVVEHKVVHTVLALPILTEGAGKLRTRVHQFADRTVAQRVPCDALSADVLVDAVDACLLTAALSVWTHFANERVGGTGHAVGH